MAAGGNAAKRESIWSVPFVLLMAANFCQAGSVFILNATLSVYLDGLGATASAVGFVFGAFAITSLLIRPFAGPAFDSFPRKRLLMGSNALPVVAFLIFSFADSVPLILFARLLQGVTIGCSMPLAMALVSGYLPQDKMASGISIYALSQTVAQVIGPAVGLVLADAIGFNATYFVGVVLTAASVLVIVPIKEPKHELLPYKLKVRRMFAPEAVLCAVMLFLVSIPYAVMNSYIVLYGYMQGIEGMSVFFVVYAVCLVGTRPLFGHLADKVGATKMILVGIACYAVANVLIANMSGFALMVVAAAVSSAGFGACSPLIQSLALSSVPQERRGAASNTAFCGMDLSMLVGPSLAGVAIDAIRYATGSELAAYSTMWLTMLVPLACAVAAVVAWNRKTARVA